MSARLRVVAPGPLSLVQDAGRPGSAGIGVGRSGAADRTAYALANRLLANPEGAAAVEATLGGLELEVVGSAVSLCVTGAPAPVSVDGRAVGSHAVLTVPVGARVRLGTPEHGLRSYVAVRGGLDVEPVLGSRSRDVLAELGPPPLREGDELAVGSPPRAQPGLDDVPAPSYAGPVVLRTVRGPRADWVRDPDLLVGAEWTASDRSNRVGMRLSGARLAAVDESRQLPSEGACRGAVQVPPSGEPVVFLADHPVTAGYPVVGVVLDADVDRAAQVRPGQSVRFAWVDAPWEES